MKTHLQFQRRRRRRRKSDAHFPYFRSAGASLPFPPVDPDSQVLATRSSPDVEVVTGLEWVTRKIEASGRGSGVPLGPLLNFFLLGSFLLRRKKKDRQQKQKTD